MGLAEQIALLQRRILELEHEVRRAEETADQAARVAQQSLELSQRAVISCVDARAAFGKVREQLRDMVDELEGKASAMASGGRAKGGDPPRAPSGRRDR